MNAIPKGVGRDIFNRMQSLSLLAALHGQQVQSLETEDGLQEFFRGNAVYCAVRSNGKMVISVLPLSPGLEFWFDAYGQ